MDCGVFFGDKSVFPFVAVRWNAKVLCECEGLNTDSDSCINESVPQA